MRVVNLRCLLFSIWFAPCAMCSADDWRAGTASVVITPRESMWMAGYASRTKPSEGTAQELHAKALAIEDANRTRIVFVTTDLIGIPRALRDGVQRDAATKYGLPAESLLLN